MNSTFTITDINKSVDDLKKNMATVKAMIDGMNNTINAAPLESAGITPLLKSIANNLTKAYDSLNYMVTSLENEISNASDELVATTKSTENILG